MGNPPVQLPHRATSPQVDISIFSLRGGKERTFCLTGYACGTNSILNYYPTSHWSEVKTSLYSLIKANDSDFKFESMESGDEFVLF